MIELSAGDATVSIEPDEGARLGSLRVAGHELLVGRTGDPLTWGCYPMVPWAGRVAFGVFEIAGERYRLPIGLPPHAIHGTGYLRSWEQTGPARFELDFDRDWPFGGRAVHEIVLEPERLRLALEVHAGDRPMPAMAGWHPWFVRDLGGAPARLRFAAGRMYERDDRHLPTGRLVPPPPRPWDDCFVDVTDGPALRWGDRAEIELESTCDHWVVYDEPEHAICVEPQTGPPDELNREPRLIRPGQPLRAELTIRWETT